MEYQQKKETKETKEPREHRHPQAKKISNVSNTSTQSKTSDTSSKRSGIDQQRRRRLGYQQRNRGDLLEEGIDEEEELNEDEGLASLAKGMKLNDDEEEKV